MHCKRGGHAVALDWEDTTRLLPVQVFTILSHATCVLCWRRRYFHRRWHYRWLACVLRTELRYHNTAQEPYPQSSTSRTSPTCGTPPTVSIPQFSHNRRWFHLNFTQIMVTRILCVFPLPLSQRRLLICSFAVIFISSNILGSLFQIASLPVVILAPLGAVSLLWNALFARFILGDVFSLWMVLGTLLIAGGAVLIAIFGIVPEPTHSLEDLLILFSRPTFVAYFSLLGFAVLVCLAIVSPTRYFDAVVADVLGYSDPPERVLVLCSPPQPAPISATITPLDPYQFDHRSHH